MTLKTTIKIPGLSQALRHHPEYYNITLDHAGFVKIDELAHGLQTTVEKIEEAVQYDDKGRFAIEKINDVSYIRALHGHSVPVAIDMVIVKNPGILYHGTKEKFLDSILEKGIVRGNRNFVHMSKDVETAYKVADRRQGKSIILSIDGNSLVRSQHTIYCSASNIFLVDIVPPEFIIQE